MVIVIFSINFWTPFGQSVAIVGDGLPFGDWNANLARKMKYYGNGNWKLEFHFNKPPTNFSYNYILTNDDGYSQFEAGARRTLNLAEVASLLTVFVKDLWRSPWNPEIASDANSRLFTEVAYGRLPETAVTAEPFSKFSDKGNTVLVRFQVHAVRVPKGYSLKICGDNPALGSWSLDKAPAMADADYPTWKLTLELSKSQIPFKYKYVITGEEGTEWEVGEDRWFDIKDFSAVINNDNAFKHANAEWRGAGVAIPIFSIRTKKSLGVGEFLDLIPLVDWAAQSGLRLLQILPINDTSVRGDWRDSYPYSSLSVFALHPMYIHLEALTKDADLLKEIEEKQKTLNGYTQIDYEAVTGFKNTMLKTIYKRQKNAFLGDAGFKQWLEANQLWVAPYALFCVFRDKYYTSDFSKWGEHKNITRDQVKALTDPKSEVFDQVAFYFFVQYNLHLQLKQAADYARCKGVGMKGDIAIGVNPKSVDTWIEPKLFRLEKQTGAPPDFFSENGQNWGFPTYNWDEMAKDDYSWWRQRLTHMAQYFSAFRIDHILGFFRIWEIPGNCVTGLLGRFNPSVPLWRDELTSEGIWDFNRLCEPYIRTHILDRYFGEHAVEVRNTFLDEIGYHSFRFKPEYNSEKQIDAALPTTPSTTLSSEAARHNQFVKDGLFRLIQNVVLLRDPEDGNKFYPRIEMQKTSSFQELEPGFKFTLERLYVDYFYRRQESLWARVGMERLPIMVNSTKMLCCGEDLGMVPKCVAPVMNNLRILGLRIQRMTDDPKKEFYHPREYDYLTVCTPSVHDTSTLRGWWEEDYDTSQRFYNRILGEHGKAPKFCESYVTHKIIKQHLDSRSMWSVFPIQDLFGLNYTYFAGRDPNEERINIPAIPEHYWKYRMHVNVEDLLHDKEFSEQIKSLIKGSGRQ